MGIQYLFEFGFGFDQFCTRGLEVRFGLAQFCTRGLEVGVSGLEVLL